MELGEKLRQARMEAGLSQRQLCGGEITRNMLSLIENGSARPSMDTLKYLSHRLGKPVSFFLDDATVCGVRRLRILHGTGNGILRTLVRQYLSTQPAVRTFHDEHVQFGGAGITVIELE